MKPSGRHLIAEFTYCPPGILNDGAGIEKALKQAIQDCGFGLRKIVTYQFQPAGVTSIAIISESHIAIHTYPEAQHASVDVFTCAPIPEKTRKLLEHLKEAFKPKKVNTTEVLRGNPLEIASTSWITNFSANGFAVRYHVKKKLLDVESKYQHIEIIENDDFGRMLFLDKDLQVAESDAHIYNSGLVPPEIGKKLGGKEVVILGGGDGGVLHETLKYNPRKVTLVDLDEDVIRYSKQYLPSICHNAFDDPRVDVVIEEAGAFLDRGASADLFIYDLTLHPEAFIDMDRETYLSNLFSKVRENLRDGGTLTLQCGSEFDKETRNLIERILAARFKEVRYHTLYIPSFCERWVFGIARA